MSSFLGELEHKDQCRYHRADPRMHQQQTRRAINPGRPVETRRVSPPPQQMPQTTTGPEFKDQVQSTSPPLQQTPQTIHGPEFKDQVQTTLEEQLAKGSLRDSPQIVTVEAVQVFSEAHVVPEMESGSVVQATEQAVVDGHDEKGRNLLPWWKSKRAVAMCVFVAMITTAVISGFVLRRIAVMKLPLPLDHYRMSPLICAIGSLAAETLLFLQLRDRSGRKDQVRSVAST